MQKWINTIDISKKKNKTRFGSYIMCYGVQAVNCKRIFQLSLVLCLTWYSD